MTEINHSRRKWLSLGGIVLGVATLSPNSVLAAVSTPKPRILRLRSINTGETFSSEFPAGKGFSSATMQKLNWFMRDWHVNRSRAMDPNLFTKLYNIQSGLGLRNTEILVISGYRTQATNNRMHRRSRGVASNSYHIKGQAVDFRIEGVPLAKIKATAERLHNGGVGYYPRSNFVHVDTGPVRTWRGS
ncbi:MULTISPECIES: DUF882 domain-containing protein [unclassified Lonepinella]|uniref:DUF882 domain-containing protein n=1 Tax=unclassified Lonepinella TaxID=2642006 RepID=UPI003F6DD21C